MGLWLVQQSRAEWRAEGTDYSYNQLATMATDAPPFLAFIDPDNPSFFPPGDMPARIREFCARTQVGFWKPRRGFARDLRKPRAALPGSARQDDGTIFRANRRPDARRWGRVAERGSLPDDRRRQQWSPGVCGASQEATVLGNAIVQLIALGELQSVADGRALLGRRSPISKLLSRRIPLRGMLPSRSLKDSGQTL